jgi:hypothetical protein
MPFQSEVRAQQVKVGSKRYGLIRLLDPTGGTTSVFDRGAPVARRSLPAYR